MGSRHALVIHGMHRSGTSALARVLSLRGADLPAHLMRANQGNTSGYWEPAPIVAFNDELLDYFGTAWDDPFAAFQLPAAGVFPKKFQQRAIKLIEQEYADSVLFILKDPRGSLLVDFWIATLERMDIRPCPIMLARPFGEVAASLQARDKTNQESAVLLYVAYCIEVAVAQSGRVTSFLRYDQLISDWRAATDRIAVEHDFKWPRTGAFLDGEVSEFLVKGASKTSGLHLSPNLQGWADTTWGWLLACSEGKAPDIAPLIEIRNQLAAAAKTFSPVLAVRRQRIKAVLASQAEAEAAASERHAAYVASQAVLDETVAARDKLMGERDLLLSLHERNKAEKAERSQAFLELLAERDHLLERFQASKAEAATATDRLGGVQSELDQAHTALGDLQSRWDESRLARQALDEEIVPLRLRVAQLSSEAETYHLERDKALAIFQSTDAALHATEASFRALAAEAENLRDQRARQEQANAQLRERYETAHAELLATQDMLRATVASGEQWRAALVESNTRSDTLRALVAELETRLSQGAANLDALQAQIAHHMAHVTALEAEVSRQAAAFQAQAGAWIVERGDVMATVALREHELLQLQEALAKLESARAGQAADAQRAQRELDNTRTELRRAQDGLEQLRASHSWRITAPLRNLTTAGRRVLNLSRQSLRRQKHLLALAPPEAKASKESSGNGSASGNDIEAGVATTSYTEPTFVRRKHAGLRSFLSAEFGDSAMAEMLLRVDRFRLPVETDQVRAASALTCSADEVRHWVDSIVRRAREQRPEESETPDVSIVVPVYNQVQFTLACVDALLAHTSRYRIEILIGDDASTDQTQAAFADPIPNVRYVRHASNLGFVRNCNATAAAARGRYIVMLNNDALVLPGWLDELIDVLEGNASVGLVGSKLIYPDGRMQECGAIVWRDGSAWNFGRLDDPRKPEHNYLRGADFISGASIALPTALWSRLGGFDEHFVPAYAEDADLAFRVRAAGFYTLVQPLSQVLHFEGISSGTDLGQGAKSYQAANLAKLYERWKEVLESHRENAQYPELEKERDTQRRMLFIDHCTLTPNEDAGSLVAFEIMKTFRRFGYKVTFIPEDNFAHMGEDTRVLQRLGVETIYHPSYSRMEHFLAARHDPFDVVLMHRFTVGDKHLTALKAQFPSAKFIFLACDLHFLRELREAEMAGDASAVARANQTKRRELAVASASDAVVVYSETERDLVQAEIPGSNVVLFPLVHDPVSDPMPLSAREGVCFVGGYRHPPNADAILWFADQVWPLVYSRCPDAVLYVAGSHMTDAVKVLGGRPGVEITGFVPDMESFLAKRRVNIAPLRFGAGVKGKVSASLANGLPTVGTSIAAEGMLLTPGSNILVADTAADFANCVIELLTQDARWRQVSEAGLRYAAEVTSSASAQERIRSMLHDLQLLGRA